jgi:hypothetical protein
MIYDGPDLGFIYFYVYPRTAEEIWEGNSIGGTKRAPIWTPIGGFL